MAEQDPSHGHRQEGSNEQIQKEKKSCILDRLVQY